MADLRIFSYLPNPRLSKATIAARFSGADLEIVGANPADLAGWLWDYEARPLEDAERAEGSENARTAQGADIHVGRANGRAWILPMWR